MHGSRSARIPRLVRGCSAHRQTSRSDHAVTSTAIASHIARAPGRVQYGARTTPWPMVPMYRRTQVQGDRPRHIKDATAPPVWYVQQTRCLTSHDVLLVAHGRALVAMPCDVPLLASSRRSSSAASRTRRRPFCGMSNRLARYLTASFFVRSWALNLVCISTYPLLHLPMFPSATHARSVPPGRTQTTAT